MTLIISRGGHELEESDSDAYRTAIVDIIRMATDVMCIIREDYRIPHVEHGRGRSPAQSIVTHYHLFEVSRHLEGEVDILVINPSHHSPSVHIDTSTQLDLLPTIPRSRRGLRRPRLLPPLPPLFPTPASSQTDVLHVSHAVPAIVREERPKRKKVPVTHRLSPFGGM
ncbi:hypothetical protein CK203_081305 [Vitis vinifera]|uniref:Uncharacterized protein n=1 Tax=Vitis vinifera TaxID=29760 RepID=A0A438DAK3_VITVI|nr:hypothetical protein CK203_081305 [Vitis vinifera]